VEEDEYRSKYAELNQQRCVFEKAINSRRCDCSISRRFMLAGREGVGCDCRDDLQLCTSILELIREKARFSLHLTQISDVLPHNKEIRVQVGGIQGLRDATVDDNPGALRVDDIHDVIQQACRKYASIEDLPYTEIVKSVAACEARQRGGRRRE
jgi:hypothetical protein